MESPGRGDTGAFRTEGGVSGVRGIPSILSAKRLHVVGGLAVGALIVRRTISSHATTSAPLTRLML